MSSGMNDCFLSAENIEKSYLEGTQKINVLKKINLHCDYGKWYNIFGSSGTGKTTLLNIISGIEQPDSGNVYYNNINIYNLNDKELSMWRNYRIGFVFQLFYLISELTVNENIIMPLKINRNRQDDEWYERVVDILGIGKLLERKPSTLSGGEKQRVAIARAVINKPQFIIADEPTGNLDLENSTSVINLLKKLKEESGIGIILATHDRELISYGDYKYELINGILE